DQIRNKFSDFAPQFRTHSMINPWTLEAAICEQDLDFEAAASQPLDLLRNKDAAGWRFGCRIKIGNRKDAHVFERNGEKGAANHAVVTATSERQRYWSRYR